MNELKAAQVIDQIRRRVVDMEITNRCNALCTFCPRDKMPPLGKMSRQVFAQAMNRLLEYNKELLVNFAGFGEPLMHEDLVYFVGEVCRAGFRSGINTNAALLTRSLSAQLLDAGLSQISFNAGALYDDYEEVYNLEFLPVVENIKNFIELNDGRCETWIAVVQNDINESKLSEIKQFWKSIGVEKVYLADENNRGGALSRGNYYHEDSGVFRHEALRMAETLGVSLQCPLPFMTLFISQEGQYYLCCHDWRKKLPLGSVFELSVSDVDVLKEKALACGNEACRECDLDPVNVITESLILKDKGLIASDGFSTRIANAKALYRKRTFVFNDLHAGSR
ncbi:MAG: radical SAM/SPASM domain-containing protein [Gammaproteobacteria bacterium]|nr:MAG: radical SAM/SPASM domain-containing protein [Gammaproteobacteria bacterium]